VEPPPAAAPPVAEPPPPAASIAGTVHDDAGAPVAQAEVLVAFHPRDPQDYYGSMTMKPGWFAGSRTLAAQTAADGTFRVEGGAFTGMATVSAFREGLMGARTTIQVEAGKAVEGVDIEVRAGKMLRGVLLDAAGKPVADAIVSAHQAWHPKDLAWASVPL